MTISKPIISLVPEVGHTKGWPDSQRILGVYVTISTHKLDSAGTSANVYLEFAGGNYLLDKPNYDDFEKGARDSYHFNTNITLGKLRDSQIRLYHDNTNSKAGWYCKDVKISILFENSNCTRIYKNWSNIGWLAQDEPPYYTLEAILQESKSPNPEFFIENPYKSNSYHYKGQCHCHSTKSDGNDSPQNIEQAYKDKGYTFVCLTDHNRHTEDPFVDNLLHIGSGEDGKSDRHHILALGINKDKLDVKRDANLDGIDDRKSRPCGNIQERINYISFVQETVSVMAHPTGSHSPDGIGFTLNELKGNVGYTGIEICNAAGSHPIWSVYNPYDSNSNNTVSWWDEVLKHKKYAVWGFATDDCHNIKGNGFNRAWIVVNSSKNFSETFPYINFIKKFETEYRDKLDGLSSNKKADVLFRAYEGYRYKAILQEEILNNIKCGNFYAVVRSPKEVDGDNKGTIDLGPVLEIKVVGKIIKVNTDLEDSTIRFITGNGVGSLIANSIHVPNTVTKTGRTASYECCGKELYVRVEIEQQRVTGKHGGSKEKYIAFSQPIFVQSTKAAREKDYKSI